MINEFAVCTERPDIFLFFCSVRGAEGGISLGSKTLGVEILKVVGTLREGARRRARIYQETLQAVVLQVSSCSDSRSFSA